MGSLNTFLTSPTALWVTVAIEGIFAYSFFRNASKYPGWRRAFFLVTGAGWVVMLTATASFTHKLTMFLAAGATPLGMLLIIAGFAGLYFTRDIPELPKAEKPGAKGDQRRMVHRKKKKRSYR